MSDDFEPALGVDESEAAIEPGHAEPDDEPVDQFEAGAPATIHRKPSIPRTEASRKAMAEAVAKFKAEAKPDDDEGEFGATEEVATGVPRTPAPKPAAAVVTAPPAPTLDPEVRALREEARAEAAKQKQLTADAEARVAAARGPIDYEQYLESPSKALRGWLESMSGGKIEDADFRQEAAHLMTLISADVLGVPVPDDVKVKIETSLMRKAMSVSKNRTAKQAEADRARAEQNEVDKGYREAAVTLDGMFKADASVHATEYPWLAAEDSPGSLIVDVIQSRLKRDGTKLSWQEASKQTNDYLKSQASAYVDKRKHLFQPVAAKPATDGRPGRPPGTQQVTRPADPPAQVQQPTSDLPVIRRADRRFGEEGRRRATRVAFAPLFKPDE